MRMLPTEIIMTNQEKVHLVKRAFQLDKVHEVYNTEICWKHWCDWPYALDIDFKSHTEKWKLIKNKVNISQSIWYFPEYSTVNEESVLLYNNAFRDMALHLYNPTNFDLLIYCLDYYLY